MGLEEELGSEIETGLIGERVKESVRERFKDGGLKRVCSVLERRLEEGLEIDG